MSSAKWLKCERATLQFVLRERIGLKAFAVQEFFSRNYDSLCKASGIIFIFAFVGVVLSWGWDDSRAPKYYQRGAMTRNPGIVLILTALVLTLSLACAAEMPARSPTLTPTPTAVTPPTETAVFEPTEAPTEMAVAVTSPVVTPSPPQGGAAGGAVPPGGQG